MHHQKVVDFIVKWLSDYNLNAKTKGYVIGISGGIDSALTSTLAAQTGSELLCISMPIHQNIQQLKRANKHIDWLKKHFENVRSLEIDMSAAYDSFVSTTSNLRPSEHNHLTLANTRARLRMTMLYFYAGIEQKLVLGTGNKVEDFGVGFFTKYGDGGVDVSPIADLLKSEVFELAKHIKVIDDIISAPPTDGLWDDDRTDEDQLGATYNELEWAMSYNKAENKSIDSRQKEVLAIYNQFNEANAHKIKPIPICVLPKQLK